MLSSSEFNLISFWKEVLLYTFYRGGSCGSRNLTKDHRILKLQSPNFNPCQIIFLTFCLPPTFVKIISSAETMSYRGEMQDKTPDMQRAVLSIKWTMPFPNM